METLRVRLDVPRETTAGAGFYVCVDNFDGVVNYDSPVSSRRSVLNRRESDPVWGITPWGFGVHGQAGASQGWARTAWGSGEWGLFSREAEYFGHSLYGPTGANGYPTIAVPVVDEFDVQSGTTVDEIPVPVNTSPRPPSGLRAETLIAGVVTLSFTPSPDLVND